MIEFSKLPVQSSAADSLYEAVLRDLGTGTYTAEELRRMVDEGCGVAVAVLKSIDGPMSRALSSFNEADQSVVEMVAVTMMLNTLNASIDLMMAESFMRMMGLKPKRG